MALAGYMELAVMILGIMFAPFNGENVEGAYLDAIDTVSFTIEPLVFNCMDGGMRFEIFTVDGEELKPMFTILRKDRKSLVFKIQYADDFIWLDLAESFPQINNEVFKWEGKEGQKTLQFKEGGRVTIHRNGGIIYLKSDQFKEMLFVVHK
jgi:hypothetical protein